MRSSIRTKAISISCFALAASFAFTRGVAVAEPDARVFTRNAQTGETYCETSQPDQLKELTQFGLNQGKLKAYYYVPQKSPPPEGRPLVVALHGCGQTATEFDDETGLRQLADEMNFTLLLPEQTYGTGNLPVPGVFNLSIVPTGSLTQCFTWFQAVLRGQGEPASIMEMIVAMDKLGNIDANRIYITGMSGGGAMTVAMLALFPDCFAAGAPIAGVAYNCARGDYMGATGVNDCMDPAIMVPFDPLEPRGPLVRQPETNNPAYWGKQVRDATSPSHQARWPSISIWQAANDRMVAAGNMDALRMQWTNVHGIDETPDVETTLAATPPSALRPFEIEHKVYKDGKGQALVETYKIITTERGVEGFGHATPVDPEGGCGCIGPNGFVDDAGICASRKIAEFWGLDQPAPTPAVATQCEPILKARSQRGR